jgi:hypothetical protein
MKRKVRFTTVIVWFLCPALLAGWLSWSILVYWDRYHGSFDSGWIAADNKQSRYIRIQHGLPSAPKELTVWFSPNQNGEPEYALTWSWTPLESGNPVSISADQSSVSLAIYQAAPLHGIWDPASGWQKLDSGYIRIIARRGSLLRLRTMTNRLFSEKLAPHPLRAGSGYHVKWQAPRLAHGSSTAQHQLPYLDKLKRASC